MDKKAEHYRAKAADLRTIADSRADETTRERLLMIIAEYEVMATACDKVAAEDRVMPKSPRFQGED
jgi:hypothetical protein